MSAAKIDKDLEALLTLVKDYRDNPFEAMKFGVQEGYYTASLPRKRMLFVANKEYKTLINEAVNWCNQTLGEPAHNESRHWFHAGHKFFFINEEDRTLFALRFQ